MQALAVPQTTVSASVVASTRKYEYITVFD